MDGQSKGNDNNFGHIDGKGLPTQTTALAGKVCFAFNDNVIKRKEEGMEREAN